MKVSVQSLKSGINLFEFKANLEELSFEQPGFEVKEVSVKSSVDKGDSNTIVVSETNAKIEFVCETCLENYVGNINDKFTVLYTTDIASFGDDEAVRLLTQSTNLIDLTEGLGESVLLSLPIRFKCSVDCKGLCDQCGANLNKSTCGCKKESMDPRWDGLRKLLNDDSSPN